MAFLATPMDPCISLLVLGISKWFKETKKKLAVSYYAQLTCYFPLESRHIIDSSQKGWIREAFGGELKENGNAHGGASDPDQTENNLNDRPPPNKEENRMPNDSGPEKNDIVIAVMGPAGSGKSTFVNCASGQETNNIRYELTSRTEPINPVSYKGDKALSGIIYLHRMIDNRIASTSAKNINMFKELCKNNTLDTVYLTTTMWDEVEESVGERTLKELKSEYWKEMIDQGSQIARCRNDEESTRKLVREILEKEDSRRVSFQDGPGSTAETDEATLNSNLYSQREKLLKN
ncbi:hypothetical protein JVU11DRAFT_7643 [Chiua virens]|nr:hypothetical protein JVU11DRAFT_7643 [Chiua virens]